MAAMAEEADPSTTQQSAEDEEEDLKYQLDPSQRLVCRFYENQYPEIEEVVMVNVRNIAEMGAYVTLLEYNNIEGMILLSELSRRRIRSVNKLIRVNRNEVVMVLRVDKEKGYIDLSKRRVSPEDIQKCEDRFNKAKAVHRVLRQVADQKKLVLKTLYQQVGWPLYKKYGHCYDAFKLVLTDQEDVFSELPNVDPETKDTLVDYIKKRLAPQPIKVRSDVEVTCFTYEGIDAVRDSLMAGQAVGTPEAPIKIKLIAPPMYVITTMTLDKDLGVALLKKALELVTEQILAKGGKIDVKMAPKAVSQREETELAAMMERLAAENEEMDGDEDD
jgi:translation initiation factor 2 subunit 1